MKIKGQKGHGFTLLLLRILALLPQSLASRPMGQVGDTLESISSLLLLDPLQLLDMGLGRTQGNGHFFWRFSTLPMTRWAHLKAHLKSVKLPHWVRTGMPTAVRAVSTGTMSLGR